VCESQAFDDLLDSPGCKGSDGFETMCSVILLDFGWDLDVSVGGCSRGDILSSLDNCTPFALAVLNCAS